MSEQDAAVRFKEFLFKQIKETIGEMESTDSESMGPVVDRLETYVDELRKEVLGVA